MTPLMVICNDLLGSQSNVILIDETTARSFKFVTFEINSLKRVIA